MFKLNNLKEKIDVLKDINNDECNFILNVFTYFENKEKLGEKYIFSPNNYFNDIIPEKLLNSEIIYFGNDENSYIKWDNNLEEILLNKTKIYFVIDIKNINADIFINTKMNQKLSNILNNLDKVKIEELKNKPKKLSKKCVLKTSQIDSNTNQNRDISLFDLIEKIKEIKLICDKNNIEFGIDNKLGTFINIENDYNTKFIAEEIDKAIKVILTKEKNQKYEYIYDEVCKSLDNSFIKSNFCDFKNNKCVAQRHKIFYPINKKDRMLF